MLFSLKRLVLVVVFLLASTSIFFAQSYSISPNDSIVVVTPYSDLNHFTIQQNNLTNGYLVFSWQQVSLNIPVGWTANLCDAGNCYPGFPTNGTMDTIFSGNYGLMSLGINPDTIIGTAIIRYAVWEVNTPAQIDTLTWIITANGSVGIIDLRDKNNFSIYPNPAKNSVSIVSDFQSEFSFTMNDIVGKEIYSGTSVNNNISLSICNFPNGVYSISIFNKGNYIETKKIVIQH